MFKLKLNPLFIAKDLKFCPGISSEAKLFLSKNYCDQASTETILAILKNFDKVNKACTQILESKYENVDNKKEIWKHIK